MSWEWSWRTTKCRTDRRPYCSCLCAWTRRPTMTDLISRSMRSFLVDCSLFQQQYHKFKYSMESKEDKKNFWNKPVVFVLVGGSWSMTSTFTSQRMISSLQWSWVCFLSSLPPPLPLPLAPEPLPPTPLPTTLDRCWSIWCNCSCSTPSRSMFE